MPDPGWEEQNGIEYPTTTTGAAGIRLKTNCTLLADQAPVSLTNGNAGSLSKGTAVYVSAAGTVNKAIGNGSTARNVVGLIFDDTVTTSAAGKVQTRGIVKIDDWSAVIGSSTLAAGSTYYLSSATAGQLTTSSTSGIQVGIALTTTELLIEIRTGLVQPGSIINFGGATVPQGYLECDGSLVSRSTYSDLFASIGTARGAGDGSTTFKLPDLRGRSSIGAGTGSGLSPRTLGTTGGAQTHTLSVAELASHAHESVMQPVSGGTNTWAAYPMATQAVRTITLYTGGDAAHNNMQPFAVTKNCIKY